MFQDKYDINKSQFLLDNPEFVLVYSYLYDYYNKNNKIIDCESIIHICSDMDCYRDDGSLCWNKPDNRYGINGHPSDPATAQEWKFYLERAKKFNKNQMSRPTVHHLNLS